jgi:hypothetical protein
VVFVAERRDDGSRAFQRTGVGVVGSRAAERRLMAGEGKRGSGVAPPRGGVSWACHRGLKSTATIESPLRGEERTLFGA